MNCEAREEVVALVRGEEEVVVVEEEDFISGKHFRERREE